MLSFTSLLVFSADPKRLSEFYRKVFNVDPSWSEGEWTGFTVGSGHIMIGPHDKVNGNNAMPERMMFNLETEDVIGEFERIKGYGAMVIAKPYHPMEADSMLIATFEDPDGNYFQIASPME